MLRNRFRCRMKIIWIIKVKILLNCVKVLLKLGVLRNRFRK